MITFKLDPEDNSKINATIECGYPVSEYTVNFSFKAQDKFYATLLLSNLREKFDNRVLSIKKDAYNKGHKDGKSKKTKREWIHSIRLVVDPDPNQK